MNVIEDSDSDGTGEMLMTRLQQRPTRTTVPVVDNSDDTDKLTQEFLAAVEMEFSSTSAHCSIVSVRKASDTGALTSSNY